MTAGLDRATAIDTCAATLRAAFLGYNAAFRAITRRAGRHFENRDWHDGQLDAARRIDLYDHHVDETVTAVARLLADEVRDRGLWRDIKARFAALIADLPDVEFAKTYFSSVSRRTFGTVGIEPELEFQGEETIPLRNTDGPVVGRNYTNRGDLAAMFDALLADYAWNVPFAHRRDCAGYIAERVTAHYRDHEKADAVLCVDMIAPVFYRDTRAYVIGKVTGWTRSTPIAIAFANTEGGIVVDAVILSERGVRVMFGFARAYFHVDLDPVGPAVVFLRKVMPRHTVHELFTVLGRAKQGKTERFRALARHLSFSTDRFMVAPGTKGMVMAVFTLPSFDVVFKLMRDRFAPPKDISHREVERRYQLVRRSNKSGRLVDAQEFRMLRLPRERFEDALLAELLTECGDRVAVDGASVVLRHVWIERRLRPLDLYLQEVGERDAARAVVDYGQALRDLAATNVFPGDLLTKNFGVSTMGHVIFYDYDEVVPLIDCVFRDLPVAVHPDDEISAEPWFSVGPNDVFPEEFARFLGFTAAQLAVFREAHGEVLTAAFWRGLQRRHLNGEVVEVLPYLPRPARP
ncbi:MAG: bifunctional isocitrate dehydrogenase kinase/phosphatase [Planctomycetes bacterium]|nr:bifunctional isocitrate dehydrogenase kinase/phosphatase [Planctomycetota bacterium]